ncbi:MAG: hemerythrin family protein [Geobacteraceae bacterium]|nr:hemerythrin family protein [Geobacteraceae bacterium]NTW78941.1 hemerythrin family protein [Geobacteraceae bacterium]
MAFFEWDDSIALGIPIIDEQHKALFDWVNRLNEAVKSGKGAETVGEVIWKLITYVTEHFSEEERLMLSCNFHGLAAHRKEHDQFVSRLREIQTDFIDGHEMGVSVLDFMVDWLVCHIKGTDQGYSRFIQQQAEKG